MFDPKYVLIGFVYLILDFLWIYNSSKYIYSPLVKNIQNKNINPKWYYAILAYIILLICIYFICIPLYELYKSKKYDNIRAILYSFTLIGFVVYGVYNTTNATIFSHYPLKVVIIDSLWGTIVFSLLGSLYAVVFS